MLCQLIAYDRAGDIVATLEQMVAKDESDNVIGLVDFEAHEKAGGRLRDIWEQSNAVGSATWPEWLAGGAYDFTVELSNQPPGMARAHISALVHKKSGHRRERAAIEAAIAERINEKKMAAKGGKPEPADIRDIVGGPQRPLLLDEDGRTKPRVKQKRPVLPVVRRSAIVPRQMQGERRANEDGGD